MTISTQKLRERIDAAIKRITSGSAPMRVPADQTDPDLVLADAKTALEAQAAEIAHRKSTFDLIVNSVCAALERAGVKTVDDPGEAIDVLVTGKDREIARLREASARALHEGAVAQAAMERVTTLEAERDRLRNALVRIASPSLLLSDGDPSVLRNAAVAALAQEQGDRQ